MGRIASGRTTKVYPVRMDSRYYNEINRLAYNKGISMNQWILALIKHRIKISDSVVNITSTQSKSIVDKTLDKDGIVAPPIEDTDLKYVPFED